MNKMRGKLLFFSVLGFVFWACKIRVEESKTLAPPLSQQDRQLLAQAKMQAQAQQQAQQDFVAVFKKIWDSDRRDRLFVGAENAAIENTRCFPSIVSLQAVQGYKPVGVCIFKARIADLKNKAISENIFSLSISDPPHGAGGNVSQTGNREVKAVLLSELSAHVTRKSDIRKFLQGNLSVSGVLNERARKRR